MTLAFTHDSVRADYGRGVAEPQDPGTWSVVRVTGDDLDGVARHLCRLDETDRHNRFGVATSDEQLGRYAHGCNLNRDIVVVLRRGAEIGGVCHLSVYQDAGELPVAELGISVDATLRRARWATRMLEAALDVARRRHVTKLVVHYLRINFAMAALVRSLGDVEEDVDGDDVTACLRLVDVDATYRVARRRKGPLEIFETALPAPRGHVVFVHGAGGDAWHWRQWVQPAVTRAGFRTTAVSLHNHGGSARRADADAESYLADIEEAVAASGNATEPPIVVGHSMGGYLAQRFAERHSVRHLVLVGSIPPTRLGRERLAGVSVRLRTRHARDVFERTMAGAPDVDTRRVRGPVSVIGGSRDTVVPMAIVRETACAYGSPATALPQSGHGAMLGPDWPQLARLCIA